MSEATHHNPQEHEHKNENNENYDDVNHNNSNTNKKNSNISMIITGFGPFRGIPTNPTTILVQELPEYLQNLKQQQQQHLTVEKEEENESASTTTTTISSWKQHLALYIDQNIIDISSSSSSTTTSSSPEGETTADRNWIVMETSARDVCKTLDGLMERFGVSKNNNNNDTANKNNTNTIQQQHQKSPNQKVILLHLGVDDGATGFRIEQCAYNDASFCVPDECGYQPRRQPIITTIPTIPPATKEDVEHEQKRQPKKQRNGQEKVEQTTTSDDNIATTALAENNDAFAFNTSASSAAAPSFGDTLTQTKVDIPKLVQSMQMEFPNVETKLSTDPGRFVCNYTYCYSMYHFSNFPCLFLHVPAFRTVPKEQQFEYVSCVMQELIRQQIEEEQET